MRARAMVATLLVVGAAGIAAGDADASGRYDYPGLTPCGTFRSDYTIHVFTKGVSRATARRIQIEYWNGPRSRKVVHGSGPREYVTLKRYPGWRCTSGAGAGRCTSGRRIAAYVN